MPTNRLWRGVPGITGLSWQALRASLDRETTRSGPARRGFLPHRSSIFIPENRPGRVPSLGCQMPRKSEPAPPKPPRWRQGWGRRRRGGWRLFWSDSKCRVIRRHRDNRAGRPIKAAQHRMCCKAGPSVPVDCEGSPKGTIEPAIAG